jgi:branched-chain amino acid transport system substrate-binding protein
VEAFRRAGPNPTRESWEKAVESLKDFDTGVLADTETFTADDHIGVHKMYAVGLDAQGQETVFTSWGNALPNSD